MANASDRNHEADLGDCLQEAGKFGRQFRGGGDGANKTKGFLSYTMIANASHAWDKIGFIPSGGAGAFASSDPADRLIDLVYSLKRQSRANARFVMNRRTTSLAVTCRISTPSR